MTPSVFLVATDPSLIAGTPGLSEKTSFKDEEEEEEEEAASVGMVETPGEEV